MTVDIPRLAELLKETSEQHGGFEAEAPAHDWWDWYAPYLHAREQGASSEDATAAADRYMKEARNIVRS